MRKKVQDYDISRLKDNKFLIKTYFGQWAFLYNGGRDQEKFDLDEDYLKRRIKAVTNYNDKLMSLGNGISKDIRAQAVLECCKANNYTYDRINSTNSITLGAVLFILDRISLAGNIEKLYEILPDRYIDDSEVGLPMMEDLEYPRELLNSVAYILQNRNVKHRNSSSKKVNRYIHDEFSARGKTNKYSECRLPFEQMIALIPESDRTNAVKQFEMLYDEFYEAFLIGFAPLTQKIYDIQDQMIASKEKEDNLFGGPRIKNKMPMGPLANPKGSGSFMEMFKETDSLRSKLEIHMAHRMQFCEFFPFLIEDDDKVESMRPEVRAKLESIEVSDPYGICFAAFFLADSCNDITWTYGAGLAVVYAAGCLLPWGAAYDLKSSAVLEKINERFSQSRTSDINKRLYDENYTADIFKEEEFGYLQGKVNLAHLIYKLTGMVPPRIRTTVQAVEDFLHVDKLTKEDRELLYSLIGLLNCSRNRKLDKRNVEIVEETREQVEEPVIEDEFSKEEMLEEIRRLKKEASDARRDKYYAERSLRQLKEAKDMLDEKLDSQMQELANLREYVYCKTMEQEEPAEEQQEEVKFPYKTRKKTVIFGGHETFTKELQPRLPDVKMVYKDATPNEDMIRNAEVIWLQTNCLSHGYYWKIIDTAKIAGVPVMYFKFSSAEKCALQLIENDKK